MASEIPIEYLIGRWAGETVSYYPDPSFNTTWIDTKIIVTDSRAPGEGSNQRSKLIFGKGKSEWRGSEYFFTISGEIETNTKRITFTKKHYCREDFEKTEIEYEGTLMSDGTIEAQWEGGQLNLRKQTHLEDLEIELLQLGESFDGRFKDKTYNVSFKQTYLDFNTRGNHMEVKMDGLSFVEDASPEHLEFNGKLRRDTYEILGEINVNPGITKNMKVSIRDGQMISNPNESDYDLEFNVQYEWNYNDVRMGKILKQIIEGPHSPKSFSNNLPVSGPELITTPSKRAYLPPGMIFKMAKTLIMKAKKGDYEALKRKKELREKKMKKRAQKKQNKS